MLARSHLWLLQSTCVRFATQKKWSTSSWVAKEHQNLCRLSSVGAADVHLFSLFTKQRLCADRETKFGGAGDGFCLCRIEVGGGIERGLHRAVDVQ